MSENMEVWVVGRYLKDTPESDRWELMGVFSTEAKAREVAKPGYHMIALTLDEPAPEAVVEGRFEVIAWPEF